MEIGSEISNKIRSAIKAKLVELGAYVDDELPDYIMVMVANKKSHTQMTEDLGLFLGQNTKKFTSWLNSLLIKLQSISGVDQPDKKKKKTGVKKKSKHRKSSESETPAPAPSVEGKPEKEVEESKTADTSGTVVPDDEPELTVQADTDEFTEEMKEFEEKSVPTAATSKPDVTTSKDVAKETVVTVKDSVDVAVKEMTVEPVVKTSPTTTVVYKPSQDVEVAVVHSQVKPRAVASHVKPQQDIRVKRNIVTSSVPKKQMFIIKREDEDPTVNIASVQPTRTVSQSVTHRPVRGAVRQRALTSTVGSVIHRPEEVDEEYDPYNPTVGRVASLVRVTARKSSVPPSMQANKSLLLKAMTDAEKSVLTARPQPAVEAGVRLATSQAYVMPMQHQTSAQTYTPTQLQLTSRSRKQEIMRNMKYTIKNQTEVLVRQEPIRLTEFKSLPVSVVAPDSRVVECDAGEEGVDLEQPSLDASPGTDTPEELNGESDVRIPEILQTTDTSKEFSNVKDKPMGSSQTVDVKPRNVYKKPKLEVEPAPAVSDTRFIVTLDGVDPEEYDEDGQEESVTDVRKTELVQEVLPQVVAKVTPPKIKPFSISLRDSDEEEEDDSPAKRAKMTERCRFWPACVNGNACQYHHPSVPCKTFPHCKFGDKCLYIHPNCMFDARCTKRDCPYTHASRRNVHTSPSAVQQPMVIIAAPAPMAAAGSRSIPCKFFPNCHNTQCPFVHPKPCRFGFNCMRKSTCPFHHPAFQEKEKLTWSANKTTLQKT